MTANSLVQGALRRDRLVVVLCLMFVVVSTWAYLLAGAGMTKEMGDMLMPMNPVAWTPGHALIVLTMWAVMMAAMMLPGAAPMILMYATMARRRDETGGTAIASGFFVVGYLAVWALFSVAATALQFGLEQLTLLSPMMELTSLIAAGTVLVAAGLYQWTPLKNACLRHCRSPLDFVLAHWRAGTRGALLMGLHHGFVCMGCCWLLMLLLFVGGVMNFAWIAGIAMFVLVEKLSPAGHWLARAAGALLVCWGCVTWLMAAGFAFPR